MQTSSSYPSPGRRGNRAVNHTSSNIAVGIHSIGLAAGSSSSNRAINRTSSNIAIACVQTIGVIIFGCRGRNCAVNRSVDCYRTAVSLKDIGIKAGCGGNRPVDIAVDYDIAFIAV